MARDPRAYLWDAREAAKSILIFTQDLDAAGYSASDLIRAAVERKFEVIGESLNQLAKQDSTLEARIPDLAQIIAFRNQLIHGYATVSAATVWNIVQHSLPELIHAVQRLLDE
ncbi:MAG: DUF86 domain-containing protein, partial [Betaproteobacteria bacterium]